jgi:branched-chain amino acid transport system permease protein
LLALAALAVRVLLLLAGLLAAALLLAGLLTRVLILLARILVLVGHSGSPFLRCGEHNGETTAKAPVWFPENFGSARSLRGADLSQLWLGNPATIAERDHKVGTGFASDRALIIEKCMILSPDRPHFGGSCAVYSRLSRTPRCCRTGFPLLKNQLRRSVPAAGAIAASLRAYSAKVGTGFAKRIRANHKVRQRMDYFAQQLINGLVLGSIYGLIAIGYTMVYGIVGMINFAHGDIFMIGGFIALISFLILVSFGLTVVPVILLIVLLVSMAITALYGWTIERIAYRPLRHSFRLAPMLSAIGMSFILINYSQIAQGARVKPVPPIITGGYTLHEGSGGFVVQLSNIQIVVVITTIVLLAIFTWLVARTRLGRDMRACEQDQTMAALLGVDVDRTISMTFVIGAALAAVAGMMYLLYYGLVDFFMGFVAGIKAFTAAVLGGIGSLPGAMLGGLLIGLIETLWSAYFSVEYKDVAAFSILIIVLIFLPTGLLGRPEVEKV